jgi:hypothetical protein
MRLRNLATTMILIAGTAALPVSAATASSQACVAQKPTAASYTWNFRSEASRLLNDIQMDAAKIRNRAATLESFEPMQLETWQAHEAQLVPIKEDVNDIGQKLCRLEQIQTAVAPWQKRAILKTAVTSRLLANNTQDALAFLDRYEGHFWRPSYERNVNNLYTEASQLSSSLTSYQEFAQARHEYRHLGRKLDLGPHA